MEARAVGIRAVSATEVIRQSRIQARHQQRASLLREALARRLIRKRRHMYQKTADLRRDGGGATLTWHFTGAATSAGSILRIAEAVKYPARCVIATFFSMNGSTTSNHLMRGVAFA